MQVVQRRDQLGIEKLAGEVIPSPSGSGVVLVTTDPVANVWRELIAQFDQREEVETVTYTPQFFAARDVSKLIEQTVKSQTDDRWKLVLDELTGSLIVSATPSQHLAIRSIFDRLDSIPAASRRPVRTFVIKNRAVSEIRDVLQQLAQAGVLDAIHHHAQERPVTKPGRTVARDGCEELASIRSREHRRLANGDDVARTANVGGVPADRPAWRKGSRSHGEQGRDPTPCSQGLDLPHRRLVEQQIKTRLISVGKGETAPASRREPDSSSWRPRRRCRSRRRSAGGWRAGRRPWLQGAQGGGARHRRSCRRRGTGPARPSRSR